VKDNIAIIPISKKFLLEFIDFEGGTILDVYQERDVYLPDKFYLTVSHPDLPETQEGDRIQKIVPAYCSFHPSLRRLERLEPPKKGVA
jgi:hypothetical protein